MDSITLIFIILGAQVIIFLVAREFFTWYWKINKLVEQQNEQIHLLKIIAGVNPDKKLGEAESEKDRKARLYDEKMRKGGE